MQIDHLCVEAFSSPLTPNNSKISNLDLVLLNFCLSASFVNIYMYTGNKQVIKSDNAQYQQVPTGRPIPSAVRLIPNKIYDIVDVQIVHKSLWYLHTLPLRFIPFFSLIPVWIVSHGVFCHKLLRPSETSVL